MQIDLPGDDDTDIDLPDDDGKYGEDPPPRLCEDSDSEVGGSVCGDAELPNDDADDPCPLELNPSNMELPESDDGHEDYNKRWCCK